ncbi:helix-turn-helix transcriptional regulator [Candidatus Thioglobus sp.]|uniref:helix-turn-helix transcriptional regulator n=1 Tax=Candidatus Thioglobus sp. TaxID=2026721 RepID=UPI003D0F9BB4
MCLKILNKLTVVDKTSLSISTIYRLMLKGLFPKQIKISERSVGWLESDIDEYIQQCQSGKY